MKKLKIFRRIFRLLRFRRKIHNFNAANNNNDYCNDQIDESYLLIHYYDNQRLDRFIDHYSNEQFKRLIQKIDDNSDKLFDLSKFDDETIIRIDSIYSPRKIDSIELLQQIRYIRSRMLDNIYDEFRLNHYKSIDNIKKSNNLTFTLQKLINQNELLKLIRLFAEYKRLYENSFYSYDNLYLDFMEFFRMIFIDVFDESCRLIQLLFKKTKRMRIHF
ncbi:hypothetical protein DERP_009046 [Dermatophagoides pteronyssinus]|uniref:Uncharacterized protein n=1 Tax=Dermatophagoides pteronyssinus TaxID=6956 RepID=A0ABQ8JG97_DERPT|nr:hypothetical protein DERP_009046 [Dermatophagoides pteronyssinus]